MKRLRPRISLDFIECYSFKIERHGPSVCRQTLCVNKTRIKDLKLIFSILSPFPLGMIPPHFIESSTDLFTGNSNHVKDMTVQFLCCILIGHRVAQNLTTLEKLSSLGGSTFLSKLFPETPYRSLLKWCYSFHAVGKRIQLSCCNQWLPWSSTSLDELWSFRLTAKPQTAQYKEHQQTLI